MTVQIRSAVPAGFGMVLLAMSTVAPLRADECYDTTKLLGAMVRASIICLFTERQGLAKAKARMQETCGSPPPQDRAEELKNAIREGVQLFDSDRQRDGNDKACADWDKRMSGEGQ